VTSPQKGKNWTIHIYKLVQKSVSVYGGVAYLDSGGVSLYFLGNFRISFQQLICRHSLPGCCSSPCSNVSFFNPSSVISTNTNLITSHDFS
jgi:hypothetical protein